jgi:hypothetical protein
MRTTVTISLCVLALAACSRSSNQATTASATNAAPAGEASADASDHGPSLPAPRAGLWQITTTMTPARAGRPNVPIQSCSDGTTPARMGGGMRGGRNGCAPTIARGADGTVTFNSDCTSPSGSHFVSHGTMTGDAQTAYQVHIESDISGAPMAEMNGHRVTDINARYMGACPSNMGPGDMNIGGRIITREQMREMRRGGGMGGGGMGGGPPA